MHPELIAAVKRLDIVRASGDVRMLHMEDLAIVLDAVDPR